MKTYRTGTLPPDLKSFRHTPRHEYLKETMHSILMLVLMAAIFFLFMLAAISHEPAVYPAGWEEVRG